MPGMARGLQNPAATIRLAIFPNGLCICLTGCENILNIIPLEGYHKRSTRESLQTFGHPMTPRTVVSMCDDGGQNFTELVSWWKMLQFLCISFVFAFLVVYNLHSKVHKSQTYSSQNFYMCIMYLPARSRYRTLIFDVCKSTMM